MWSDSCVPQNRNSILALALKQFMVDFKHIEEISQKFSEPGHGLVQEVDNLHSQIEKRLKGMEIFSPLSLIRALKTVNQRKPLQILQMNIKDFKDYQTASKKIIEFKNVPFASVKYLKYLRDKPSIVFYKLTHDGDLNKARLSSTQTRSKSVRMFHYPEIKVCPRPTQCLLAADKVKQLYSLFKYMPDVDKLYMKTFFYEYKNENFWKNTVGNNTKKNAKVKI